MARGVAISLPALLAVVVYAGRLDGPFIFDDTHALLDNPSIRSLSLATLVPPRDAPVAGRPLLNLTFALSWAIAGNDPTAFHLHNLLLHCLVVTLGLFVTRRALRSPRLPERVRSAAHPLAVAAACLWAVHPMASEVVLYATQRSELLVVLLFLASLAAFQCSLQGARAWRLVALGFAVLGAFAKATIVVLPPLALAYDRALVAPDWASIWRSRRGVHGLLALSWLPVAFVQAQSPRPLSVDFFDVDYMLAQLRIVAHYLQTFVWPGTLVFDYGVLTRGQPLYDGVDAAVVAALIVGIGLAWRHRPAVGLPGVCLLLLLAPTSTLASIHLEIGAERRMYLAMLPLSALVVAGGWVVLSRFAAGRAVALGLTLAAVIALGTRSFLRGADYASVESIWRSAIAAWPTNPRAHHNLGETLRLQGRSDEALEAFLAAVEADPRYTDSHVNIAGLVAMRGERARAIRHLEQAAAQRPLDAAIHRNLRLLRWEQRSRPPTGDGR